MYETAVEGVYRISLSQFKEIIHYGDSYKRNDVERRILKVGKEIINNIEECDFTFDYSFDKQRVNSKLETFIIFYISDKYKKKRLEKKVNEELKTIIEGFNYTETEITRIIDAFEKSGKPTNFLIQALTQVLIQEKKPNINLLIYFINNGFTKTDSKKSKNKFNNFEGRNYTSEDFKKLEDSLRKE